MKNPLSRIELSSSFNLGKRDKRIINKELQMELLDKDLEYRMHKGKNKVKFITKNGCAILFNLNKKYFPTIRLLEEVKHMVNFHEIYVDDGALGPINNGADVMVPGMFRHKDMIGTNFKIGDAIVVKMIDGSIIAIGEAAVNFEDVNFGKFGVGVRVYHRTKDELYNLNFA